MALSDPDKVSRPKTSTPLRSSMSGTDETGIPKKAPPPLNGLSNEDYKLLHNDFAFENDLIKTLAHGMRSDKYKQFRSGGTMPGSGYSIFGHDYAQSLIDDEAYRSKFYKQDGESEGEWVMRLNKDLGGASTIYNLMKHDGKFDKRVGDYFNYEYKKDKDGKTAAEIEKDGTKGEGADLKKQLDEFINELRTPLKQDDEIVNNLMQRASGNALSAARLRGIEGGLSIENSEAAGRGAALQYKQGLNEHNLQRSQLGLQAVGLKNSNHLQALQGQAAASQQRWENQVGLGELRRQQDPTRAVVGAVGAGVGAVGGFFAGGPAGAAAGGSAGWNIGSGLGGMMQGGGNYPAPPRRYGGY